MKDVRPVFGQTAKIPVHIGAISTPVPDIQDSTTPLIINYINKYAAGSKLAELLLL
jgi:hypothetical protein